MRSKKNKKSTEQKVSNKSENPCDELSIARVPYIYTSIDGDSAEPGYIWVNENGNCYPAQATATVVCSQNPPVVGEPISSLIYQTFPTGSSSTEEPNDKSQHGYANGYMSRYITTPINSSLYRTDLFGNNIEEFNNSTVSDVLESDPSGLVNAQSADDPSSQLELFIANTMDLDLTTPIDLSAKSKSEKDSLTDKQKECEAIAKSVIENYLV